MVLPPWGQLEKATDDNQTIEEAIAAAIAVHESDSEAHLGSGESLESHKTEGVIDHPIGSVLADKFTFTESLHQTSFDSIDAFSTFGYVSASEWPGLTITAIEADFAYSSLSTDLTVPSGGWAQSDVDWLFQISFYVQEDLFDSWFMGIGGISGGDPFGAGFYYDSGSLYAVVKETGVDEQSSAISWTPTDLNTLRVQCDGDNELVYFFLNGVQVAVFDVSGASGGFLGETLALKFYGQTSEEAAIRILNMIIAREGA